MGLDVQMVGGDAARKLLDSYSGKAMDDRIQTGTNRAAKVLVPIIRREIKRSVRGHGRRPGYLAQRVTVRKTFQSRIGGDVGSVVKSIAQHNHLVIRGHRIVSHAGVDSGAMSRPNPFIARSEDAAWGVTEPIVKREVFK